MRRLILLGCVMGKGPRTAPARELYRSPLWNRRRAYAEASGQPWLIYSAKHGLVHPLQELEPYNETDPSGTVAAVTARQLAKLGVEEVELHMGERYAARLAYFLRRGWGIQIRRPVKGLGIGQQLAWYKRQLEVGSAWR